MLDLTDEQKRKDINDRCDAAMDEIRPILEKYQVEFAARLHAGDAAIIAMPVLKDMKYKQNMKSPIQLV
mgnify:CR=1 FL=1